MPLDPSNPFSQLDNDPQVKATANTGLSPDNPFSQLGGPPPTTPQQQNAKETAGYADSFMAGVAGFNRQFEKLAIGTMQLGSYAIPGQSGVDIREKLSNLNRFGDPANGIVGSEGAQEAWDAHPYAYGTGAVTGLIGQGIAAPTQGITQNAVSGAVFGAAQPGENFLDHVKSSLMGGAIGAAAGMLMHTPEAARMAVGANRNQAGSTAGAVKRVFDPQGAALQDTAYMADTALSGQAAGMGDDVGAALANTADDFTKLGMKGTPGQITGSPELQAIEAATTQGPTGRRIVQNFQQPQVDKLKSSISETINKMAPDEVKAFVADAKPQLAATNVSDDAVSSLLSDGQLQKMMGSLPDNIEMSQLPNNSLMKWDYIKQNIDDTLFNDKHALSNKLGTDVRDSLMAARNKIIKTLDSEAGELYQPYRAAAQKVSIQNNYNKLLETIPNVKGEALDVGGSLNDAIENLGQVSKTLWGNKQKINSFLDDVKTVGGDVDTAKAIVNVSNILSKHSLDKVVGKSPNTLSNLFKHDSGMITQFLDKMVNGSYKQALLDLTVSGQDKWIPLIKKEIIRQGSEGGKIKGLMKLINRASESSAANIVSSGAGAALVPAAGQAGGILGSQLTPFGGNERKQGQGALQ